MDISRLSLPRGVIDKIGSTAKYIKQVESIIHEMLSKWGYNLVLPAPIEFEDVLSRGIDDDLFGRSFRVDDWETGRLLVLPPDLTPQIARVSATRLRDCTLPHRLSYSGIALRHSEHQSGRQREVFQSGAELIGSNSHYSDSEILLIVIQLAEEMKVRELILSIGHIGVCQGVLDSCGGSKFERDELKKAVALKDKNLVETIIVKQNIPKNIAEQLLELTRLFGGIDVLDRASKIRWNNASCKALDNLRFILDSLSQAGIDVTRYCSLDLGELRGLGYHTGITFEGYSRISGDTLFSGGRYDTLLSKFGTSMPATGFTCDVNALAKVICFDNEGASLAVDGGLIVGSFLDYYPLAQQFRSIGISIVVESSGLSYEEALQYMESHNMRFLLYAKNAFTCILRCRCSDREQSFDIKDLKFSVLVEIVKNY